MLHDPAGFDLAALLGQENPAAAMAAIAARLETLDADGDARLREEVVVALERSFGRGTHTDGDWFELLLEGPLLNGPVGGADLPPEDGTALQTRLCRLLVATLEDMAPEERGRRAATAARTLHDISLLGAVILAIERDPDGQGLGESLPEIRKALLDRIGVLAATSAFWAQRFPAALLWFWFVHGEEQRVYHFTRSAMDDPNSLAALLTIPLEHVGTGEERQDVIAVRRWSRIIDFQALEARAVVLAMSAPSRTDRRRARRYLDAFANGKSELFR